MRLLLDLLFPPRCAFCGAILEESSGTVCPACREALPGLSANRVCQAGEYRCAVAFFYDGPVKAGVRALKFGRKAWRAEVFGRCIAQTAAELLAGEFDAVTYVPVSWQRKLSRGFDQARLLAQTVGCALLGRPGGGHPAEDPPQPGPVLSGRSRAEAAERPGRLRPAPPGADGGPAVSAHRRCVHHRQHAGLRRRSADGGGSCLRSVRGPGGRACPPRGGAVLPPPRFFLKKQANRLQKLESLSIIGF